MKTLAQCLFIGCFVLATSAQAQNQSTNPAIIPKTTPEFLYSTPAIDYSSCQNYNGNLVASGCLGGDTCYVANTSVYGDSELTCPDGMVLISQTYRRQINAAGPWTGLYGFTTRIDVRCCRLSVYYTYGTPPPKCTSPTSFNCIR
jgi:hypothetical protein